MHPRLRLLAASTLLLAACATTSRSPSLHSATRGHVANVPVLLVSIDGLRARDVDAMPTLQAIGKDGVRAQSMRPSYPSLTFPNHYSIVTGLRPDHHGIVHNSMFDAQLGKFALNKRDAVGDGRWWGGTPIWNSVQDAGGRSATMFWPGSEANIQGQHPTYWKPFDANVTPAQRVQQVFDWLDLPAKQRPQLVTLYFDQVDHQEHEHGPDSREADAARAQIDAALKQLRDGLHARKLDDALNLIIVSDHGMAAVAPGNKLALEDMAPLDKVHVVSDGEVVGINAVDGDARFFDPKLGRERHRDINEVAALDNEFDLTIAPKLRGRHDHYTCWRSRELPPQWHYGSNPRVPAVVCQMDEGWEALPREQIAKHKDDGVRGAHGYDPALASMQATFIAAGPAFKHGATLPTFDNVDVYPLLARLLNIAPAPNDGDIAPLLPALQSP